MRKKTEKPNNQIFTNLINFLSSNHNYKNKFIEEKTGIKSQRIADVKFGSASISLMELSKLKDVFSVELADYVEPAAEDVETKSKNQLKIEKLEAEIAELKVLVFDNLRRLQRVEEEKERKKEGKR